MTSPRILFSALLVFTSVACPSESDERDVIVEKLYRDYSLEFVAFKPEFPTFADQPESVLTQYLTPDLASLILKDRECSRREKKACWIDTPSPWVRVGTVWRMLNIDVGEGSDVVARFTGVDGVTSLELRYKVVRSGKDWRIDDFSYEGYSLRENLRTSLRVASLGQ
jgi:hypothetical protein